MKRDGLRKGNLIETSQHPGGKVFLRAFVVELLADGLMVGGLRKVAYEDCAGIKLDVEWVKKFGLKPEELPKDVRLDTVHDLQNWYFDNTKQELTIRSYSTV